MVPDLADEGVTDPIAPYATPTGEPCPRQLRTDGSVEGAGGCYGCGSCLLFELAAWPEAVAAPPVEGGGHDDGRAC